MSDVAGVIERLQFLAYGPVEDDLGHIEAVTEAMIKAVSALAAMSDRIAELERERDAMVESRNFTLSDHQRLLRRSDVEGICDSIGSCFEDPDGVARCGPCAIKAAEAVGVVVRYSIPHAPQEARLGRELRAAEAKLAKAEEALKPFAAIGDVVMDFSSKRDTAPLWGYDGAAVTYGDFRRASGIIAKAEGRK